MQYAVGLEKAAAITIDRSRRLVDGGPPREDRRGLTPVQ
jgi:hypothetical protein